MGVDKKQERMPAMTMAGNQTLPFQFRLVHSRPLVQPILAASFMSTESEKLFRIREAFREGAGANLP